MRILNPRRGPGLPLYVEGPDIRPQCIHSEDWEAVDWKGKKQEREPCGTPCRLCGGSPAYTAASLCGVCGNYQRKHGVPRPARLIEQARARRMAKVEK